MRGCEVFIWEMRRVEGLWGVYVGEMRRVEGL